MARDKSWLLRVPTVVQALEANPGIPITAAWLAELFELTPCWVLQIFKPVADKIGRTTVYRRDRLISFLKQVPFEDPEVLRRERFVRIIDETRRTPRVLVEAPPAIVNTELEGLPGVYLAPGEIRVTGFKDHEQALEKLLALAYAIGNDIELFEQKLQAPRQARAAAGGK